MIILSLHVNICIIFFSKMSTVQYDMMYVISSHLQNLGRDVVWRAAEGGCRGSILDPFFTHPKVRNFDVTLQRVLSK